MGYNFPVNRIINVVRNGVNRRGDSSVVCADKGFFIKDSFLLFPDHLQGFFPGFSLLCVMHFPLFVSRGCVASGPEIFEGIIMEVSCIFSAIFLIGISFPLDLVL